MLPSSMPSSEIIISDKKGLTKALSHDIIQSIQEEKKEVKQMLIKMSKHATQDRIDRLLFIYDNVGIGEPYIDSVENDILYTITTTGVLLVRSMTPPLRPAARDSPRHRPCWRRSGVGGRSTLARRF